MFNSAIFHHTPKTEKVFVPYNQSEIEALIAGFEEVADERAYNGRYFIRGGKKWIHNLGALRNKLIKEYGYFISDEELSASAPEGFGYDVENYYSRHKQNDLTQNKDFQKLMEKVRLH